MKFRTTLVVCFLLAIADQDFARQRKHVDPAKKIESVTIVYQFNGPPPGGGREITTTLQHPLVIASLNRDLGRKGTRQFAYTGCMEIIRLKVQRRDGTNATYTKEGSFLVGGEKKLGWHLRNSTYKLLTVVIEAVKESKTESQP